MVCWAKAHLRYRWPKIHGLMLTSPLKLMLVNQQQFANQEIVTWPRKAFSKDISKLEFNGDMRKADDFAIIFILNEMIIHTISLVRSWKIGFSVLQLEEG